MIFVIIGIFRKGLKFEQYLCNGCHNLIQQAMNFNDVAIVSVKGSDNKIHFWFMSRNYGINIMKSSTLNEKSGLL